MKIFLAIASGFVLTLAIFVTGAATAVSLLSSKPVTEHLASLDATSLWTSEPVRVDTARQDFERLPAQPVSRVAEASPSSSGSPREDAASDEDISFDEDVAVDMMTTAAIEPDSDPSIEEDYALRQDTAELAAAHVEWCSNRYRSYSPRDNSYNPYRGGRRECISPYLDAVVDAHRESGPGWETASVRSPSLVSSAYADEAPRSHLNSEHVRSCFERYRSYRPEDNSYQPYGGGPRRQCR